MPNKRHTDPRLGELSMNLQNALASIDWTVVDELKHIPRGGASSPQEELRHEYAAFRTLHRRMSDQLTRRDALVQAMVNVRREYPSYVLKYDDAFFFGGSPIAATLVEDELAMAIHAMAAAGGDDARMHEGRAALNGHLSKEHHHTVS
jgi:hypothetical protein